MDYFVSIENIPHQQWQAELLIESFKQHDLDENLVVALAWTNIPSKIEFCRNIYSHPRTHAIANMGLVRGFERMNRLYAMANMLRAGTLKQPFIAIESDNLLYKPFAVNDRIVIPHVIFQANPFFTLEAVKDNIPNLDKYLPVNKDWPTLGGSIYFNNVPQGFFDRAVFLTEMLAYEQAMVDKPIWKHTDRVAWAINIMDMLGQSVISGQYTMEMNLMDHGLDHNFINYERGTYPHFAKLMYSYTLPAMLSLGDPFDALIGLPEHVGTTTVQYLADLAKKCIDARKKLG